MDDDIVVVHNFGHRSREISETDLDFFALKRQDPVTDSRNMDVGGQRGAW